MRSNDSLNYIKTTLVIKKLRIADRELNPEPAAGNV